MTSGKNPDVALEKIVVDRHPAIFGVTRRIVQLVSSVRHGITELAARQDLRGYLIEPFLEDVQDGNAVLPAEAANAALMAGKDL